LRFKNETDKKFVGTVSFWSLQLSWRQDGNCL